MEPSEIDFCAAVARPTVGMSRALTPVQRTTLQAALFRVLPSTDGPGACEAEAMAFVDWITKQPYFERAWESFATGLNLLEATARSKHGASFHECALTTQDDLLAALTVIPHLAVRHFFATLVRLAVLGFLSPAGYPGNRCEVGFHYMGYADRPVSW